MPELSPVFFISNNIDCRWSSLATLLAALEAAEAGATKMGHWLAHVTEIH